MSILSLIQSNIGQATVDNAGAGKAWLIANGFALWDFTTNTGLEDSAISSQTDLTGKGNSLVSTSPLTPKLGYLQSGFSLFPALKARTQSGSFDAMRTAIQSSSATPNINLFNGDFDFLFSTILQDGRNASSNYIMGSDDGPTRNIECYFNSAGALVFTYAAAAATKSVWTCTGAEIKDDMTGLVVGRVQLDFTNDTVKCWINGVATTVTLTSGNTIAAWTSPVNFYTLKGIGIGGRWNGTAFLADALREKHIIKMAVAPIISDLNYLPVHEYMIKI